MSLGARQQRKYNKLQRIQGTAIADAYADKVQNRTGGGQANLSASAKRAANNVNTGNFGSIANSQRAENIAANQYNAPNQRDMYGSRDVTFDSNGVATATTNLNDQQQQLLDQQVGFRQNTNNFVNQQMGQYQGFNPSPYQDPRSYNRSELESMYHANKGDMQNMSHNSRSMQQNVNSMQQNGVPQFNEFDNYRQGVQNRAMDMYDRNTSSNLNSQREQLKQQLINSGNQVGSPMYEKEMNRFEQSSNNARLNAQDQAFLSSGQEARGNYSSALQGNQQGFQQGFQTNQQRFDQNFNTNAQRFDQQYATSMAPIEATKAFLPYAGQFTAPNYGQIQQFSPAPVNSQGLAAGMYSSDNSRQASLGAAGISAGATTTAAGISANGALQRQQLAGQQAKDQFAFEQGFNLGV